MSTDDEIPAVSDIENAKKSDGTSTAGEHNVDKVNDAEEQSDEVKKENTKCNINEIENDKEKTNDSKEEDNKKMKIIEQSTDETNPEVLNQELIIV